jgi:tetratricopeptide (TPR) repeat protein
MRIRRALPALVAAVLGAIAAAVAAPTARGDTPPSAWDAARDPAARSAWELHAQVRELMAQVIFPRSVESFAESSPQAKLERARILLEDAAAATSPDVRLRFDLGEVYSRLELWERAIDVLAPALEMAPDAPDSGAAYDRLAAAYAHLDRSAEERRVYERYLPRVTDEETQANLTLNLAEANMHLGDMRESVAAYREAIALAARLPNIVAIEDPVHALAVWGLAVALDRSGDVRGGAEQTRFALELDPGMRLITRGAHVFFAPERERDWYVALGYGDLAARAPDAETSAVLWQRSEGCWREYVDDVRAHAARDRWVDLAQVRLEKAHAARVAAERRARRRVVYVESRCVD